MFLTYRTKNLKISSYKKLELEKVKVEIMKKFRNIKTGIVEVVTNEKLIAQYEKHKEAYEEVKGKKAEPKAE